MSIIRLLPEVRGKYRESADLSQMCWFKVGGKAEVLFIPEDPADLKHFLQNKPSGIDITIIGVGSNLLIRDGGIKGVVIRLGRGFTNISHNEDYIVTVGAGVLDLNLALYTKQNGITGLEFFAGIPGTIGGALAMNAGAYGSDVASVLLDAKAVNIHSGMIKALSVEDIGYFYRGKVLSDDWLFVEARLQGRKGNIEEISQKIVAIQEQRSATQPVKSRTSGSTFKNPEGAKKAWQLIDEAGCRGLRIGGAEVSTMHCNFFINTGNATASDIEELISTVKGRVFEHSGIALHEEIKMIGIA